MQIAERVIEIIEDMEKQSPKMRAIVQYKKEEIFKVCFLCIYMIYLYIPFSSMPTSVDLNSGDFFWPVGFEAAFFSSNLSPENFSSQIIPTPTH